MTEIIYSFKQNQGGVYFQREVFDCVVFRHLLSFVIAFLIAITFSAMTLIIPHKGQRAWAADETAAFPFRRTRNGQITVSAALNGNVMEMIFDTGAEECLFGSNQAQKAGLDKLPHGELSTLHTVSGPVHAYYLPCEINLANLKHKVRICVQDEVMEMGILGAPFLRGYDCTIDNRAGVIRLYRSGGKQRSPIDSVAIPFEEDGHKMIVGAMVNNQSTLMCFDTGAFGVCFSKEQAETLGIKIPDISPNYTRGPNGKEVQSWDVTADVSLGPFSKRACKVRILDNSFRYPLLGQNFFADKLFTIDRQKKEIKFAR